MLARHRAASGTSASQSAQKVCRLREQSLDTGVEPVAKKMHLLQVIQFFLVRPHRMVIL